MSLNQRQYFAPIKRDADRTEDPGGEDAKAGALHRYRFSPNNVGKLKVFGDIRKRTYTVMQQWNWHTNWVQSTIFKRTTGTSIS